MAINPVRTGLIDYKKLIIKINFNLITVLNILNL